MQETSVITSKLNLWNSFKTVFLFFLFSNTLVLAAQEIVLEFDTDYEAGPNVITDSFSLVDETTEDFTVFLTRDSNLSAFHFDSSYNLKGWLASREMPNKYKIPLGGTIQSEKYSLFYTNGTKSKFAVVSFDFETNWSFASEIDLKLTDEIFLSQFNFENKFHILTTTYRESLLHIYAFDNSGKYDKTTIDLEEFDLYGPSRYPTRLKSTLGLDISNKDLVNMLSVQEGLPYSLDSMVSVIKLYIIEDTMFVVSDINRDFTQIISHHLKEGKTQVKSIEQAKIKFASTNSFLTKDNIFQIAANPKEMVFQVTNLETKEVVKRYQFSKSDSLSLANGPIRQRGGRYKAYRELEKTAQFLRKLGHGNPAIHIKPNNDRYEIQIGSVDDIDDGLIYAVGYLNPFTAIATFGALTLYANPVALALIKASDSRAVYINNTLDSNFEPTFEQEKDNIFYIINDFIEEENVKRFTAADVFVHKEQFLFGMLDKKTKKYVLRKFIP